jgi:hypothetical protein
MKKHYLVGVREIHVRFYTVESENEDQAKELVDRRTPEATDMEELEYSHELDRDTWSVEEVPDKDDSPSPSPEGAQL